MKEMPSSKLSNRVPDELISRDEHLWDELFSRPESEVLLERLTNEALEEFRTGKIRNIDPSTA